MEKTQAPGKVHARKANRGAPNPTSGNTTANCRQTTVSGAFIQGNRMNTFVIAPGCLPGYRTSETPPEREIGGLQTRPYRQFHRCKPLLTRPCRKLFLPAAVTSIAYGIHAIALARD
jgi:hypothetical protein